MEKAFNYKSPTFQKNLASIGSIDLYFDNVGGELSLETHTKLIFTVSAR